MIAEATKLRTRLVEKPWGSTALPTSFGLVENRRIGEIWFEDSGHFDPPLLVKYIFTSEPLSIQVHPDDAQARSRGLPRGKSECWYILDAAEGATIGYGLKEAQSKEDLKSAARSGTIDQLLNWQPVSAGDFLYVPSGTIHAIGAGIALLELQQNSDTTYRLYDYGRDRPLHIEEGISVVSCRPPTTKIRRTKDEPSEVILLDGPHFSVVRATGKAKLPKKFNERYRWAMPLEGKVESGSQSASTGECLLLQPGAPIHFSSDALVLIAADGPIRQASI